MDLQSKNLFNNLKSGSLDYNVLFKAINECPSCTLIALKKGREKVANLDNNAYRECGNLIEILEIYKYDSIKAVEAIKEYLN